MRTGPADGLHDCRQAVSPLWASVSSRVTSRIRLAEGWELEVLIPCIQRQCSEDLQAEQPIKTTCRPFPGVDLHSLPGFWLKINRPSLGAEITGAGVR